MSSGGGAPARVTQKLGATRLGVLIIRCLVAPLDRWLYRLTKGKLVTPGKPAGPILLLSTRGRHSGQQRTTPVFFLRDQERIILCNANPGFEKTNPWVLNLRAYPVAIVQIGSETLTCQARDATLPEIEHYWPALVRLWPAYETHFQRSKQRAVFILERA